MIPKVIHYCWFGGNPLPETAKRCMRSWKKFCPDYDIVEWNETNFDIAASPLYVQQAYAEKKWAFVTDYVRLKVVYENGGIYLDTDVELLKSLDDLRTNHAYFGFEGDSYINTGVGFGAEMNTRLLRDLMSTYENDSLKKENGKIVFEPCPQRDKDVFVQYGCVMDGTLQTLRDGSLVLPKDYLCPMDVSTHFVHRTKNTVSIHLYDASWQSEEQRKAHDQLARSRRMRHRKEQVLYFPRKIARKLMGDARYEKIKRKLKGTDQE